MANGKYERTPEIRAKTSAALTGRPGRPHSSQARAKIAEAMRGSANKQLRHGHKTNAKDSRTYKSWESMIARCTNPNKDNYPDYGGRGIDVCARWNIPLGTGHANLGFENFLADMGERPPGTTIDRRDNSFGYFKENCTWATAKVQARNRRVRRAA